jgi:hypothetical protein
MSENESISKLKSQLEKVENRKSKLNDEETALRQRIEKLNAFYGPAREKFIKEGVAKIQEQCGWTRSELIKALGGTIDSGSEKLETKKKRAYVNLVPLEKDGNIPSEDHITLTPRLKGHDKEYIDKHKLVPLLKHTINVTLDEDNRKRAEARLKKEEAKGKAKK